MGKGFREYIYKGWQVRASVHYGDWECQPAYTEEHDPLGSKWERFVNNENIRFDTLREAKAWVGTDEAKILKEKYQ